MTTARPLAKAREARLPARFQWIPGALAGVWALVALSGMGILWRYKSTPGPATTVQAAWPEGSRMCRSQDGPTCVLFVHPCCPCSRASRNELAGLLPRFAGRLTTYVCSFEPSDPPPGWGESILSSLASLSTATPIADLDGREATLFGVETSGHVLLYGRRGELCYSGGISAARGHEGDNPGLRSLESALLAELAGQPPSAEAGAPVFGCAIHDPGPIPPGVP